ncbi:WecB/TagA/CpsF family glycosyltransferase [Methylobacillus gramineus]|uniref:WecB/TagA/CpsF family glycosyltransferase n=1 Tax=Methylobacillus gramineus TaxID=755169 RepID=UPI001CFFFB65|nr:WecB/TagA/CpsF family glycosyltransferase [Methylobacillus gramineus]MCB5183696.1 WecB/TagA/CpsF family glycosyltransferase [Methylobacillus gramineus]
MSALRKTVKVLAADIDVITWPQAVSKIAAWAKVRHSAYVCICNVHSVVSATQSPEFEAIINQADMATPDGAPVAWVIRRKGEPSQERINGPDLMWKYCAHAESTGESIFLYGGMQNTLDILRGKLAQHFPKLKIAGMYSPPFRPLTAKEDQSVINQINQSGAGTVWISLGCPKQEKWMAEHKGKINAVMVGVGAAFDYHAGTIVRAPLWMQKSGLEWLHRLASEPRRLWKRYLVTNSLFIFHILKNSIGK